MCVFACTSLVRARGSSRALGFPKELASPHEGPKTKGPPLSCSSDYYKSTSATSSTTIFMSLFELFPNWIILIQLGNNSNKLMKIDV